jgi:CxxC motif-containing protein (DUF1111 family)
MSNHLTKLAIAAVAMAVGAACSGASTDEESTAQTSEAVLGDSLAGITATDFATVKANFNEPEQITDGLGPIFNERGCGNCHNNNASGGAGDNIERRFGRFDNNGQSFNPLANEGGSLRQLFSNGQFNNGSTLCTTVVESEPADATVHNVGRLTTPTFGLGLVDTLPDSFFQAIVNAEPAATKGVLNTSAVLLANPDDPNEITGATRVNRYGWKAAVPVLEQFAADAYVNEMGITTQSCVRGTSITAFCTESAPNGKPQPPGCDDLAPLQPANFTAQTGCPQNTDDAVGACSAISGGSKVQDDVANFATFMTFLAPPPQDTVTSANGKAVFAAIGCANCHVDNTVSAGALGLAATFKTPAAPAGIRAADGVLRHVPGSFAFHPFSDFATHDMGTLGDMIGNNPGDSPATTRRMRTAPLWGVRFRNKLMHDGRAADIRSAITAHNGGAQGQGTAAATAFGQQSTTNQNDLITYVRSL